MPMPSWTVGQVTITRVVERETALDTTRRDLLDACADEPVQLIGTHFPAPTAGYVRREGEGFRLVALNPGLRSGG